MNQFGENLKNNSKVSDIKEYIDTHKKSLEEINKFIDNLKEESKDYISDNSSIVNDTSDSVSENLEKVSMNVLVDPITGEQKIIGRANEEIKYNFEGVIKQIDRGDPDLLTSKPFTEQEIISYLKNSDDNTLVDELAGDINISANSLRDLLDIVNRKLNGEKFNIYKESPEDFQKLVDSYITESMGAITIYNAQMLNTARNKISNSIIEEFIHNIKMDRAKTDFAKELENIYNNSTVMASEGGIKYIEERNSVYREAANSIEDEGKKERLNAILDRIDEARNLIELKEFAKTCKIKKYDLERPEKRIYNDFLSKYRDSVNNIYDISIAETVLTRHLSQYGYTKTDIVMVLIAFCKQCKNYSVDNVLDHAYMYYFLYYCAMLDGDKSDKFKNNIIEVIKNLKERNKI